MEGLPECIEAGRLGVATGTGKIVFSRKGRNGKRGRGNKGWRKDSQEEDS